MTPSYATVYAVRGQLYNLSVPIKALSTGNALTGGLTSPTAVISKDDGSFASTTNSPVEIGTTGWLTLDLTATEMNCSKALLTLSAANSGAVFAYIEIRTLNLAQFNGRWDAQSPNRFEQLWLDLFAGMALNGAVQNGAQLQLLNPDGSVHFQSSVTQNLTSGTRSKAI